MTVVTKSKRKIFNCLLLFYSFISQSELQL
jgi:hypothetical protein